jgi:hypothetical protein
MAPGQKITLGRRLFIAAAIALFLVPAGYGFVRKFAELLILAEHEEHAFVIMPIVNYLLSSIGFCMMLFWATAHGMFHDVERPKVTMLEQERMLDAMEEENAEPRP